MSRCYMFNPSPSIEDRQERIVTLGKLCLAAEITWAGSHPDWDYSDLCNTVCNSVNDQIILYVHSRDLPKGVTGLSTDVVPWPDCVFAFVYTAEPNPNEPLPVNDRIKYLKASFPIRVWERSNCFELLVRAMRAAAAGDVIAFKRVDINSPIVPAIVTLWEDVDVYLQGGIEQGGIPLFTHVKEALRGKPTDYNILEDKHFFGLDPEKKTAIMEILNPANDAPSPFWAIHKALASGEVVPPMFLTPEIMTTAHEQYAQIRRLFCVSSES